MLLLAASQALSAPRQNFVASKAKAPPAYYPEGPQWIGKGLLVAEMPKDRIVLLSGGRAVPVWQQLGCGPTSVKRIPGGGYWVLCHLGHHVVRLDPDFKTVSRIAASADGKPISWPNDASVDADGNLYLSSAGIFSLSAPAEGRVIFIRRSTGEAVVIASGIRYSNGVLVQEKQRRLLVSEHLGRRVLAFPLGAPGVVGAPTVFFDFAAAPAVRAPYALSGADGLASFANGDICIADYGNGRIIVVSSTGKYVEQIPVEYRYVTNLAILPDQQRLFVTMTRDNTSEALDGVVREFLVHNRK